MTTTKTVRAKRRTARAKRHANVAESLAAQERAAASKPNTRRRFVRMGADVVVDAFNIGEYIVAEYADAAE